MTLADNASQRLSGVNTYGGATTIGADATLALVDDGSIALSSGVVLAGTGAKLDISGANGGRVIKNLAGVTGTTVRLGDNSLTAGTADSTAFAGVIDAFGGNGGFVKQEAVC